MVDYAFGSLDHFTTFVGRDDYDRSVMLRMSAYETTQGLAWDLATGLARQPADDGDYLGIRMVEGDGGELPVLPYDQLPRRPRPVRTRGGRPLDRLRAVPRAGGHHVEAVAAGFPDLGIAGPGRPRPPTSMASALAVTAFPSRRRSRPIGPIPPGTDSSR